MLLGASPGVASISSLDSRLMVSLNVWANDFDNLRYEIRCSISEVARQ